MSPKRVLCVTEKEFKNRQTYVIRITDLHYLSSFCKKKVQRILKQQKYFHSLYKKDRNT